MDDTFPSRLQKNKRAPHVVAGDACGNIRVWDLTAGACACELVPEVGTSVRSLTVAMDGSMLIAGNNQGKSPRYQVLLQTVCKVVPMISSLLPCGLEKPCCTHGTFSSVAEHNNL